jgi:hypothetical protein
MTLSSKSGFEASAAQRHKMRGLVCAVCWKAPVDPAHVVDRSIASDRSGDPRRVVPLCRIHHREYDDGERDLLSDLTKHYPEEVAFAVLVHPRGLVGALERITNHRWSPDV